jgi:exonuclease III
MLQRFLVSRRRNQPNLRIVTWNCAMALRKKWEHLVALTPDVAVLQECEMPEKWPSNCWTSVLWTGDNPHKGLAVVSFGPWRLEAYAQLDSDIKYVLPAYVSGPCPFRLLGVWTKPSTQTGRSYIGQLYHAAHLYSSWLAGSPSVVAGDWNSNAQWDRPQRAPHAATVAKLADCGLKSAYHYYFRQNYGQERHATWYNHKRLERGFHLDYCFVPEMWLSNVHRVEVGRAEQWLPSSDHCPLVVDIRYAVA